MLKRLTVSNLAIVERAEVEFASGLNVITGETGSGKSVLMGALEILLGGRADADAVRDGAKEAEVEAEFGDGTVVRRTVTASGRTRAWVNDESVSVAELKDLGHRLVDVHGPRANQALLEERFQREALDAFGGLDGTNPQDAMGRYRAHYAALVELNRQIGQLQAAASGNVSDEIDMLRYQVDELEGAELVPEDDAISERHAAAAHVGEIIENANAITESIGGDMGAAESLIRLQPLFRTLAKHMPEAEAWGEQAEEVTMRLQELSRSIADAVSRLDVEDEDLAALDARLTLVNRLLRKYGEPRASGLIGVLERKRARLSELEHLGERLAELTAEAEQKRKAVAEAGAALSKVRKGAAARLAKRVTDELRDLGFLKAKLTVELEPVEPGEQGCDRVIYLFEPNPGEAARPLSSIASSGEIARVMLALKVVVPHAAGAGASADRSAGDTLVFDEIDANIGGEVGRIVGEKMRAVAGAHQVIAITHLPQSAACGDRHLVVSKAVAGGRTRTQVAAVCGEDRVKELARMLGGTRPSGVVMEHARELLAGKGR